jgi:hypothetical protein
MLLHKLTAAAVAVLFIIGTTCVIGNPHRIVVDTDVDTDDLLALLYLLKLNTSQFQLEVLILLLLATLTHSLTIPSFSLYIFVKPSILKVRSPGNLELSTKL